MLELILAVGAVCLWVIADRLTEIRDGLRRGGSQ